MEGSKHDDETSIVNIIKEINSSSNLPPSNFFFISYIIF